MEELNEIAGAAAEMLNAFDKWLAAPDKAKPEATALMECRNSLAIKLNAYYGAFGDLLTEENDAK